MKLKVPNEEASNIIGEIGCHGMGYLFENMDEMDIQAERRNTAREKQRADEERQRADKEKQLKIEAEERAEAAEKQVAKVCGRGCSVHGNFAWGTGHTAGNRTCSGLCKADIPYGRWRRCRI